MGAFGGMAEELLCVVSSFTTAGFSWITGLGVTTGSGSSSDGLDASFAGACFFFCSKQTLLKSLLKYTFQVFKYFKCQFYLALLFVCFNNWNRYFRSIFYFG